MRFAGQARSLLLHCAHWQSSLLRHRLRRGHTTVQVGIFTHTTSSITSAGIIVIVTAGTVVGGVLR
jgi:hypothetical protein